MKKTVRRAALLLLVCALFLTVAPSAFAAAPRAAKEAHVHTYGAPTVEPTREYHDKTWHYVINVNTYTCTECGYVKTTRDKPYTEAHSGKAISATCNGTIQTITNYCSKCKTNYPSTQNCPKGPHTGNCQWLPASVVEPV